MAESISCHVLQGAEQPRVIGYVLGRMEDKGTSAVTPPIYRDPRSRPPPSPPSTPTGHVTSLAVLPGYRRCGVAGQLMSTLHDQASYIDVGVGQVFSSPRAIVELEFEK